MAATLSKCGKIFLTIGTTLVVLSCGLTALPFISTRYMISRTKIKQGWNLRELYNNETGRSIIMIGMSHVGKPEFYANVKKMTDSLIKEEYVVFYEGIGIPRNIDSLKLDTLYRKRRKVIGSHITNYLDSSNKSRNVFNNKKYVVQDYQYLGLTKDDSNWIHADYTLDALIEKYERDKGEIILTDYDWSTPLIEKYRPKKNRDTVCYHSYYLTTTLRNQNLSQLLLESPHKRIVVLYGLKHLSLDIRGLKDSLELTDSWD